MFASFDAQGGRQGAMGGQVRTGVGGGRRRDSRGGTEAPLARPRTPLSPLVRRSAGTTGRRSPAAGSRARRVGGSFLVLWINLYKTVDIL